MTELAHRRVTPTLLTFAPMVDSETSRLLLRYYRIEHCERDHLFGWVSILTLLHGGYGQVPLLYGAGRRLTGPRALAAQGDAMLPAAQRLMPIESPLATQVEADWTRFNSGMGADTAVFAYFHLLPLRALMTPIFAAPVPPIEARLTPLIYAPLRGLFTLLLRLSHTRATVAAERIRSLFADTDRRIADGRRFLCGDRLTLGDIALSGAAAPLLQPTGYGTIMPPVPMMPDAIQALVGELQRGATARLVQRVYDGLPALPKTAAG